MTSWHFGHFDQSSGAEVFSSEPFASRENNGKRMLLSRMVFWSGSSNSFASLSVEKKMREAAWLLGYYRWSRTLDSGARGDRFESNRLRGIERSDSLGQLGL